MHSEIAESTDGLVSVVDGRRLADSSLDEYLPESAAGARPRTPEAARVLLLTDLLALGNPGYRTLLEKLAALYQDRGYEVLIGGSPWLQGESVRLHWDTTRLGRVAREHQWRLANFEREALGRYTVGSRTYLLPRLVTEASLIINVATAYRHRQWRITGALFSLLNAIPGWKQSALGRLQHHGCGLDEVVADLAALISPGAHLLCLVAGPAEAISSDSAPSYVLASSDPVALDSAAAALAGLRCDSLAFLRAAAGSGLGLLDFRLQSDAPGDIGLSWRDLPRFSADRLTPLPPFVERVLWQYWGDRLNFDVARCVRCDGCRRRASAFSVADVHSDPGRGSQDDVFQDVNSVIECDAGPWSQRERRLRTLRKVTGRKSCDI